MEAFTKKQLFDLYQYVSPAVLTPLAWFLWYTTSQDTFVAFIAVCIPISFAYIVPGIGTNVFKLWKFNSPLMLGNFRIHHGFVFGSATSVIVWLVAHQPIFSVQGVMASAAITSIVLALINTFYDIEALKSGVVQIFNQPWAEGKSPSAIVMDYSFIIFGLFGFVYAGSLKLVEWHADALPNDLSVRVSLFFSVLAVVILVPVCTYIGYSYIRYRHTGLWPVSRNRD